MAFNSNSYHRNRYRREALELLAKAREAKDGDVQFYVRLARLAWSMYLSYLRLKQCDDDLKACREGKMTYATFMAKWGD